MPIDYSKPFDLYNLFVNEVIGSWTLTLFIGYLILLWVIIKYQVNWKIGFMLIILYSYVMLVVFGENNPLWAIFLFAVGAFVYYMLSKALDR